MDTRQPLEPAQLRSIRTRLGASQIELSLILGTTHQTISNWEAGRVRPKGPALCCYRLLEALLPLLTLHR